HAPSRFEWGTPGTWNDDFSKFQLNRAARRLEREVEIVLGIWHGCLNREDTTDLVEKNFHNQPLNIGFPLGKLDSLPAEIAICRNGGGTWFSYRVCWGAACHRSSVARDNGTLTMVDPFLWHSGN